MAVLGRVLISSAERLDLPDFLSIDSFAQGDFKYLIKSFIGDDKPFTLKGFDVINPGDAIGTQNISIRVADSVVYYPGSLAGPFFYGLEEGNVQSAPLVPELRKNATNYVYLTLTTKEAANDTRAFWDVDREAGAGGEFTQDVNTQTVLSVDVNVSASSFPENTVPVCKVVVGPNFIESIEDARDMMFRLGSGGLNPNPLARYSWREEPTSVYDRLEPNSQMTNSLDPNPFEGGDKNIETLKEWMDAVMTKLAELGGTTYWYEDTSVFNVINVFKDALTTSIKSKGKWNSSDITPGLLSWSEDITIQSTADLTETIIRDGNKTLANDEVMYIDRVRDAAFNTGSISVEWFNSVNYINGQLGAFENLSKGDWVKKADDSDDKFLRVEEFYAGTSLGGGVTAPGNALSIKLSGQYQGAGESKQGSYLKGVYLASEVQVAPRNDSSISGAAGNFYWMAMRSDTILNVSNIETTTLTLDISNHDGSKAKVVSTAHGLEDGQRITISGSSNFDGTYAVSVEDVDTFFINVTGGPFADENTQSAYFATVTTAARDNGDGLELESANHGLDRDQLVVISDTTNYNSSYKVFPTGNTTFTVPVPTIIATETSGVSTVVNIYVRTDIGPTKLEQGENKFIGEVETANLMDFIGMDNDAQIIPGYYVPGDYNTRNGYENFNSDLNDNLTQRISRLTSMMADKAQDKTIIQSAVGVDSWSNLTSGSQRVLSASPGGTFTAMQPNSPGNFTLNLTGSLALEQNQVAVYTLDRDAASNLTDLTQLDVYDIDSCPIHENLFVFAYRLTDTRVYLWDSRSLEEGITLVDSPYIQKVNYIDLLSTSLPTGSSVTIDSGSVSNGNMVLFTNLSSGSGVYQASGIGSSVEWTKVICFQGGSTPLHGSNVNITSGTDYFDSTWRYDGTRWKPLDSGLVAKARTGFPAEAQSNTTISFDDLTRTFTISPVSGHYDIYQRGVPYRFDSGESITIPDVEGTHFIYFDNGSLVTTTSFDFDIIEEWVYVANLYWDAANQSAILIGDERHGLGMDAQTHAYLHNVNGAQITEGFSLGNFTISGDGTANADAQVSISGGQLRDEDIVHNIVNSATPSANFEQILDPVAEIPVWYRTNVSGLWRKQTTIQAPVSVGANTLQWNEFNGTSWQLTDATDGQYVAQWIFITNDITEPVISIMGQEAYDTLGEAQDGFTYESISFGTLPAQEIKVAYRLIYQTNSTYTNDYKSLLADVRDLRTVVDTTVSSFSGTYHGALSGLTDQHHPASSIFVANPSQFSGAMTPDDDDVKKALESIDPWFRQLRTKEHDTNKKRVTISAADALRTEGTTLSQVVRNLLLKFDGAEVDFSTGSIYESDGTTSLGIDFTPETIPTGEWLWYSLTLIPSTVNADNTISGQIIVLPADGSGATKELAPKAPFANGTQLGMVAVQEDTGSIADIFQDDIRQLGVGGGSGGGTGDANELLERLKNRLQSSTSEYLTPVIFSSVEKDLTDSANTTASFSVVNSNYDFTAISQQFVSAQLLDDEFLQSFLPLNSVELVHYWDLASIDTAATYEVSRDGGANYQTVSMGRIGNSDTYRGVHEFADEPTFSLSQTIGGTITASTVFTDANSPSRIFSLASTSTVKTVTAEITKTNAPTGYVYAVAVKDNGGVPSTDPLDVIGQSKFVSIDLLAAGAQNVDFEIEFTAPADSYHIIFKTDETYKTNYTATAGADTIAISSDGTGIVYTVKGLILELKVRITSGTAEVVSEGFGVLYRDETQIEFVDGTIFRNQQTFVGDVDNFNIFTLDFLPDPKLLQVFEIQTGQVYRYGAFVLDGKQVVFEPNTFNKPDTVTLEFLQINGNSFDNSDANVALLASNHLGSTDSSIDLSVADRGILLRSADGTLYEIVIKNGGTGFDIYEVS